MKIFNQSRNRVLAFILAGGKGERLYPLTEERSKPAVPFGGKYRIIDFTLSNFLNSGIFSIYVLVQYKSQSLIEHVRTNWLKAGFLPEHFITIVPPQMRKKERQGWYQGTVDSIYQNINLIYDQKPDFIAIFGGDHIFRMDIKKMIEFHVQKKAHLTIAAIPVDSSQAFRFGAIQTGKNKAVKSFSEKKPHRGENKIYASMGNYLFSTDFFLKVLENHDSQGLFNDFGMDMIPRLVKDKARIFAYDFSENKIAGLKRYESPYYWRDVGTIPSFWKANIELLGVRPKFNLNNKDWPIHVSSLGMPPATISGSSLTNSLICEGSVIDGSEINNSIIGRSVFIEKGCRIINSIIMGNTWLKQGCFLKNTIVDRFNLIKKNTRIDSSCRNRQNYFNDPSGITILKRGKHTFKTW